MATTEKPGLMTRIAMRRVGSIDRLEYLVAPSEVMYFFAGSVARRGLVHVVNYDPMLFQQGRVYARTSKEVYVLRHRSLAELMDVLDPDQFKHTHQSIVVNITKASFLDPSGKVKMLGFVIGNGTRELVPISRRFLSGLLPLIRRPPRPGIGPDQMCV